MTGLPSRDWPVCAAGQVIDSTGGLGVFGLSPQLAPKRPASSNVHAIPLLERNSHLAAKPAQVTRGWVHFRGTEHHG